MATIKTRFKFLSGTTEEWNAKQNVVLMQGEAGIEILLDAEGNPTGRTKQKNGDGVHTWAQLSYVGGSEAKTFEVTDLSEITDAELSKGDTAIVKTLIEGTTDKYSYTGYVYNGTAWAAMDGNYNASNVYFDDNMMVTTNIGYITISNGSGTIPSKGKNLEEVFEAMFVQEKNPSNPTKPSITLTLGKAGTYEAGTTVTGITYAASFNDGYYEFGPEPTGSEVAGDWTISDSDNNTYTDLSGSLDDIVVEDTTNFTMSASVPYSAGATPFTNKGNECTDTNKQIKAGTATKTSSAIKGYREGCYYGTVQLAFPQNATADQVKAIVTSNVIRTLPNKLGANYAAKTGTSALKYTVNPGDTAIIIACPAGKTGPTSVLNTTVNAEMITNFKTVSINVGGADATATNIGNHSISYDVYYYIPANAYSGNASLTIELGA